MIRISKQDIEKYDFDFKAGVYKNDSQEAILYNRKLEEEIEASKNYVEKRVEEYPEISDIIDAIFKKNAGDSTEYNSIAEKRQAIKEKYKKQ